MNKFLQRFSWHLEFNTLDTVYSKLEDIPSFEEKNVFFLAGLKEPLNRRASDNDISVKNYFVLDLDVRSNSEDDISDEEIKACADILEETLDWTPFSTWSYINYSGNGLHIYYIWKDIQATARQYSDWVGYIYKEWEKIVENQLFSPDYACRNIWRIMRLPWSVNQKNWKKVEVIKERNVESKLISFIPQFAEKEEAIKEKEIEERRQRALEVRESVSSRWRSSIWDDIDTIPAYQISEWLLPEFKYTWNRNFLSGNKSWNKYTAFYYSESRNCIINGGSRHYNWWDSNSWWWPFDLVKRFKGWSDKETFEFFKKLIK